jgi:hypothetical protein
MGEYWLKPSFIALFTRSVSAEFIGKSGKPCPRFTALCSVAKALITVKIVVPTLGSLDWICKFNNLIIEYNHK